MFEVEIMSQRSRLKHKLFNVSRITENTNKPRLKGEAIEEDSLGLPPLKEKRPAITEPDTKIV
jgi:hypothetical protein